MELDFTFEFYSKVPHLRDEEEQKLRSEAETQLRKLAAEHSDMTGASVVLDQPAHRESPFIYMVRIMAYVRPEDVVAVEKADTMQAALNQALAAVERQVRDKRERLRERRKQP